MSAGVFWDASALVKAYVDEIGTPNVKGAIALRVRGYVSDFVALEVVTTFGKCRRQGSITPDRHATVLQQFRRDFPTAFHVLQVEAPVRRDAMRLAESHHGNPTGALDLLHLATARYAARLSHPAPLVVASSDQALLDVARAEGLETYNPETQPHGALRAALRLRAERN